MKRRAFLALPAVAAAGALRVAPRVTRIAVGPTQVRTFPDVLIDGQPHPIYSITITKPDIDAFAAQLDRAWGDAMHRRSPWQSIRF